MQSPRLQMLAAFLVVLCLTAGTRGQQPAQPPDPAKALSGQLRFITKQVLDMAEDFPAENFERVKERISKLLREQKATTLACSAACGADLLALEAAGELRIERRVVLPFPREVFRRTSVVDRPGNWGERYDQVLDDVERQGNLIVLGYSENSEAAYPATNEAILNEGARIARATNQPLTAIVVWNGKSRGQGDLTEHFQQHAQKRHLTIEEVRTLD